MTRIPAPLSKLLRELSPLAIAFSGGLDSRFLAHAANLEGVRFKLYHIAGPHVPQSETAAAASWAQHRGFAFECLLLNPLEIPEVRANSRERCYFCKRTLFGALQGSIGSSALCDGSNASDLHGFRPGLRAAHELGVRSPLAEAAMDKAAIRIVGAATGLDKPDQAARPCLLTRFAYDLSPAAEALQALELAEAAISALLTAREGSAPWDFRLRLVASMRSATGKLPYAAEIHLNGMTPAALRQDLCDAVISCGFESPRLMLSDAISGHYDRV